MSYPVPDNEDERLQALRELEILDSAPEQVYDDVVRLAAAICGVPMAIVNFVDADRQWGKALIGLETSEAPREASFCARTIVQDQGVLVVPDTHADSEWVDNAMVTDDPNVRFYAGAAIVSDEGHAFGTVCVADHQPRQLDADQLEALRILARQTASHLELRRRSRELVEANDHLGRMALEDSLTGLPNRALLIDRLTLALRRRDRSQEYLAVTFCDINDFKAINDRYGHDVGDDVLRAVSRRLADTARASDTVARLAGDEFVVVSPDLSQPTDIAKIEARLHTNVSRPVTLDDVELTPHLSLGTVLAQDGDDAREILRRADVAMYLVKRAVSGARLG